MKCQSDQNVFDIVETSQKDDFLFSFSDKEIGKKENTDPDFYSLNRLRQLKIKKTKTYNKEKYKSFILDFPRHRDFLKEKLSRVVGMTIHQKKEILSEFNQIPILLKEIDEIYREIEEEGLDHCFRYTDSDDLHSEIAREKNDQLMRAVKEFYQLCSIDSDDSDEESIHKLLINLRDSMSKINYHTISFTSTLFFSHSYSNFDTISGLKDEDDFICALTNAIQYQHLENKKSLLFFESEEDLSNALSHLKNILLKLDYSFEDERDDIDSSSSIKNIFDKTKNNILTDWNSFEKSCLSKYKKLKKNQKIKSSFNMYWKPIFENKYDDMKDILSDDEDGGIKKNISDLKNKTNCNSIIYNKVFVFLSNYSSDLYRNGYLNKKKTELNTEMRYCFYNMRKVASVSINNDCVDDTIYFLSLLKSSNKNRYLTHSNTRIDLIKKIKKINLCYKKVNQKYKKNVFSRNLVLCGDINTGFDEFYYDPLKKYVYLDNDSSKPGICHKIKNISEANKVMINSFDNFNIEDDSAHLCCYFENILSEIDNLILSKKIHFRSGAFFENAGSDKDQLTQLHSLRYLIFLLKKEYLLKKTNKFKKVFTHDLAALVLTLSMMIIEEKSLRSQQKKEINDEVNILIHAFWIKFYTLEEKKSKNLTDFLSNFMHESLNCSDVISAKKDIKDIFLKLNLDLDKADKEYRDSQLTIIENQRFFEEEKRLHDNHQLTYRDIGYCIMSSVQIISGVIGSINDMSRYPKERIEFIKTINEIFNELKEDINNEFGSQSWSIHMHPKNSFSVNDLKKSVAETRLWIKKNHDSNMIKEKIESLESLRLKYSGDAYQENYLDLEKEIFLEKTKSSIKESPPENPFFSIYISEDKYKQYHSSFFKESIFDQYYKNATGVEECFLNTSNVPIVQDETPNEMGKELHVMKKNWRIKEEEKNKILSNFKEKEIDFSLPKEELSRSYFIDFIDFCYTYFNDFYSKISDPLKINGADALPIPIKVDNITTPEDLEKQNALSFKKSSLEINNSSDIGVVTSHVEISAHIENSSQDILDTIKVSDDDIFYDAIDTILETTNTVKKDFEDTDDNYDELFEDALEFVPKKEKEKEKEKEMETEINKKSDIKNKFSSVFLDRKDIIDCIEDEITSTERTKRSIHDPIATTIELDEKFHSLFYEKSYFKKIIDLLKNKKTDSVKSELLNFVSNIENNQDGIEIIHQKFLAMVIDDPNIEKEYSIYKSKSQSLSMDNRDLYASLNILELYTGKVFQSEMRLRIAAYFWLMIAQSDHISSVSKESLIGIFLESLSREYKKALYVQKNHFDSLSNTWYLSKDQTSIITSDSMPQLFSQYSLVKNIISRSPDGDGYCGAISLLFLAEYKKFGILGMQKFISEMRKLSDLSSLPGNELIPEKLVRGLSELNDIYNDEYRSKKNIINTETVTKKIQNKLIALFTKNSSKKEFDNIVVSLNSGIYTINTKSHSMALIVNIDEGIHNYYFMDPNYGLFKCTNINQLYNVLFEALSKTMSDNNNFKIKIHEVKEKFFSEGIIGKDHSVSIENIIDNGYDSLLLKDINRFNKEDKSSFRNILLTENQISYDIENLFFGRIKERKLSDIISDNIRDRLSNKKSIFDAIKLPENYKASITKMMINSDADKKINDLVSLYHETGSINADAINSILPSASFEPNRFIAHSEILYQYFLAEVLTDAELLRVYRDYRLNKNKYHYSGDDSFDYSVLKSDFYITEKKTSDYDDSNKLLDAFKFTFLCSYINNIADMEIIPKEGIRNALMQFLFLREVEFQKISAKDFEFQQKIWRSIVPESSILRGKYDPQSFGQAPMKTTALSDSQDSAGFCAAITYFIDDAFKAEGIPGIQKFIDYFYSIPSKSTSPGSEFVLEKTYRGFSVVRKIANDHIKKRILSVAKIKELIEKNIDIKSIENMKLLSDEHQEVVFPNEKQLYKIVKSSIRTDAAGEELKKSLSTFKEGSYLIRITGHIYNLVIFPLEGSKKKKYIYRILDSSAGIFSFENHEQLYDFLKSNDKDVRYFSSMLILKTKDTVILNKDIDIADDSFSISDIRKSNYELLEKATLLVSDELKNKMLVSENVLLSDIDHFLEDISGKGIEIKSRKIIEKFGDNDKDIKNKSFLKRIKDTIKNKKQNKKSIFDDIDMHTIYSKKIIDRSYPISSVYFDEKIKEIISKYNNNNKDYVSEIVGLSKETVDRANFNPEFSRDDREILMQYFLSNILIDEFFLKTYQDYRKNPEKYKYSNNNDFDFSIFGNDFNSDDIKSRDPKSNFVFLFILNYINDVSVKEIFPKKNIYNGFMQYLYLNELDINESQNEKFQDVFSKWKNIFPDEITDDGKKPIFFMQQDMIRSMRLSDSKDSLGFCSAISYMIDDAYKSGGVRQVELLVNYIKGLKLRSREEGNALLVEQVSRGLSQIRRVSNKSIQESFTTLREQKSPITNTQEMLFPLPDIFHDSSYRIPLRDKSQAINLIKPVLESLAEGSYLLRVPRHITTFIVMNNDEHPGQKKYVFFDTDSGIFYFDNFDQFHTFLSDMSYGSSDCSSYYMLFNTKTNFFDEKVLDYKNEKLSLADIRNSQYSLLESFGVKVTDELKKSIIGKNGASLYDLKSFIHDLDNNIDLLNEDTEKTDNKGILDFENKSLIDLIINKSKSIEKELDLEKEIKKVLSHYEESIINKLDKKNIIQILDKLIESKKNNNLELYQDQWILLIDSEKKFLDDPDLKEIALRYFSEYFISDSELYKSFMSYISNPEGSISIDNTESISYGLIDPILTKDVFLNPISLESIFIANYINSYAEMELIPKANIQKSLINYIHSKKISTQSGISSQLNSGNNISKDIVSDITIENVRTFLNHLDPQGELVLLKDHTFMTKEEEKKQKKKQEHDHLVKAIQNNIVIQNTEKSSENGDDNENINDKKLTKIKKVSSDSLIDNIDSIEKSLGLKDTSNIDDSFPINNLRKLEKSVKFDDLSTADDNSPVHNLGRLEKTIGFQDLTAIDDNSNIYIDWTDPSLSEDDRISLKIQAEIDFKKAEAELFNKIKKIADRFNIVDYQIDFSSIEAAQLSKKIKNSINVAIYYKNEAGEKLRKVIAISETTIQNFNVSFFKRFPWVKKANRIMSYTGFYGDLQFFISLLHIEDSIEAFKYASLRDKIYGLYGITDSTLGATTTLLKGSSDGLGYATRIMPSTKQVAKIAATASRASTFLGKIQGTMGIATSFAGIGVSSYSIHTATTEYQSSMGIIDLVDHTKSLILNVLASTFPPLQFIFTSIDLLLTGILEIARSAVTEAYVKLYESIKGFCQAEFEMSYLKEKVGSVLMKIQDNMLSFLSPSSIAQIEVNQNTIKSHINSESIMINPIIDFNINSPLSCLKKTKGLNLVSCMKEVGQYIRQDQEIELINSTQPMIMLPSEPNKRYLTEEVNFYFSGSEVPNLDLFPTINSLESCSKEQSLPNDKDCKSFFGKRGGWKPAKKITFYDKNTALVNRVTTQKPVGIKLSSATTIIKVEENSRFIIPSGLGHKVPTTGREGQFKAYSDSHSPMAIEYDHGFANTPTYDFFINQNKTAYITLNPGVSIISSRSDIDYLNQYEVITNQPALVLVEPIPGMIKNIAQTQFQRGNAHEVMTLSVNNQNHLTRSSNMDPDQSHPDVEAWKKLNQLCKEQEDPNPHNPVEEVEANMELPESDPLLTQINIITGYHHSPNMYSSRPILVSLKESIDSQNPSMLLSPPILVERNHLGRLILKSIGSFEFELPYKLGDESRLMALINNRVGDIVIRPTTPIRTLVYDKYIAHGWLYQHSCKNHCFSEKDDKYYYIMPRLAEDIYKSYPDIHNDLSLIHYISATELKDKTRYPDEIENAESIAYLYSPFYKILIKQVNDQVVLMDDIIFSEKMPKIYLTKDGKEFVSNDEDLISGISNTKISRTKRDLDSILKDKDLIEASEENTVFIRNLDTPELVEQDKAITALVKGLAYVIPVEVSSGFLGVLETDKGMKGILIREEAYTNKESKTRKRVYLIDSTDQSSSTTHHDILNKTHEVLFNLEIDTVKIAEDKKRLLVTTHQGLVFSISFIEDAPGKDHTIHLVEILPTWTHLSGDDVSTDMLKTHLTTLLDQYPPLKSGLISIHKKYPDTLSKSLNIEDDLYHGYMDTIFYNTQNQDFFDLDWSTVTETQRRAPTEYIVLGYSTEDSQVSEVSVLSKNTGEVFHFDLKNKNTSYLKCSGLFTQGKSLFCSYAPHKKHNVFDDQGLLNDDAIKERILNMPKILGISDFHIIPYKNINEITMINISEDSSRSLDFIRLLDPVSENHVFPLINFNTDLNRDIHVTSHEVDGQHSLFVYLPHSEKKLGLPIVMKNAFDSDGKIRRCYNNILIFNGKELSTEELEEKLGSITTDFYSKRIDDKTENELLLDVNHQIKKLPSTESYIPVTAPIEANHQIKELSTTESYIPVTAPIVTNLQKSEAQISSSNPEYMFKDREISHREHRDTKSGDVFMLPLNPYSRLDEVAPGHFLGYFDSSERRIGLFSSKKSVLKNDSALSIYVIPANDRRGMPVSELEKKLQETLSKIEIIKAEVFEEGSNTLKIKLKNGSVIGVSINNQDEIETKVYEISNEWLYSINSNIYNESEEELQNTIKALLLSLNYQFPDNNYIQVHLEDKTTNNKKTYLYNNNESSGFYTDD